MSESVSEPYFDFSVFRALQSCRINTADLLCEWSVGINFLAGINQGLVAPPSVTPVIQIPTVTAMTRTTYAILAMFIFTNISLQISLDVCNTFGLSFQMSSLSKQMSSLSELNMEKVKRIIVHICGWNDVWEASPFCVFAIVKNW